MHSFIWQDIFGDYNKIKYEQKEQLPCSFN
jgi:hypothetical protein